MKLTLDIGGTNIRIALWENGKITEKLKYKTIPEDFEKSLKPVLDFIASKKGKIKELAAGIPGPANYENGLIINPPNLKGWWNKNIKDFFIKNSSIERTVFENDANLMALANHHDYGYTKKDITQFFTISTGFGAGLIVDGKIFTGAFGRAQEIASLPANTFDEENRYSKGAIEWFASGSGMEARALKTIGKVKTKEIFELARNGNKEAELIVDQAKESIANLIAIVSALINPTSIIFDGSIARNEEDFIYEAIKLGLTRTYPGQGEKTRFHTSSLGDDSTLIGAHILLNERG